MVVLTIFINNFFSLKKKMLSLNKLLEELAKLNDSSKKTNWWDWNYKILKCHQWPRVLDFISNSFPVLWIKLVEISLPWFKLKNMRATRTLIKILLIKSNRKLAFLWLKLITFPREVFQAIIQRNHQLNISTCLLQIHKFITSLLNQ